MTTYNTGNPVGSVDVRDLYDNAENLDNFSNGPLDAYPDRFGVPRQSWAGMEAEFDADQVDRSAQWAAFLLASGYQVLGPYGAGLVFTAPNQLFSYLGEFYSHGPSITLPYTTTGVGAAEIANFRSVGDAVLRQDLGEESDPARGASLVGGLIASNLTINVPADQPTINAAFVWLRSRTIARGAVVTIKVADGTHTLTQSINGNHPQGVQVRLIGNETTPSLCVVRGPSPATFDALVVSNGHTLGYVNGLRLDLASKSEWPYNSTGILANNGARIICGPKVEVNNWYYGIAARNGSFISCRYAKVSNAGDVGIWAFVGSTVEADYAESTGAGDAVNPWGFGFQAEFGSAMICTGATASGCKVGGIAALSNSTVRAHDSIVNANTGAGYVARGSAIIEANGGATTNNGGHGISVEDGAYVLYFQTNTGNTAGPVNTFAFMGMEGGQSRVASSLGALRLDTSDASSIYMNTAGGLQFEVQHVASAANRLYVAGAPTGAPIRLGADGPDADIDVSLEPKGSGKVRFGTTQAIPGGFANNSIIEIKSADGAVVQIQCKRL